MTNREKLSIKIQWAIPKANKTFHRKILILFYGRFLFRLPQLFQSAEYSKKSRFLSPWNSIHFLPVSTFSKFQVQVSDFERKSNGDRSWDRSPKKRTTIGVELVTSRRRRAKWEENCRLSIDRMILCHSDSRSRLTKSNFAHFKWNPVHLITLSIESPNWNLQKQLFLISKLVRVINSIRTKLFKNSQTTWNTHLLFRVFYLSNKITRGNN